MDQQPIDLTQTPQPVDKPANAVDLAHPGSLTDLEQYAIAYAKSHNRHAQVRMAEDGVVNDAIGVGDSGLGIIIRDPEKLPLALGSAITKPVAGQMCDVLLVAVQHYVEGTSVLMETQQ